MKQTFRSLRAVGSAAVLFSMSLAGFAQRVARLATPISGGPQVVLQGSKPGRAMAANDIGELPATTAINGITLVLNRTPAQELALQTLLAAQQNPASPLYHQWLTPAQFGAQFGVADSDLAAVESWLTGQGFNVTRVSPARDRVTFSGTAGQLNSAFGASIHRYQNGSKVDYAPSTDLALPAALAPLVSAVLHTSTFRPQPMVKRAPTGALPDYTLANNTQHFLTPRDVATMYDVNPTYSQGFTGTGQTVAVAGQTFISLADVTNFENATGLPANLPTLVLEPNTGGSGTYPGDEFESDIDVEYATGMAPGANVLLVYTGDSPNFGVFDAFDYAIEEDLAPVVSISYGSCEALYGTAAAQAGDALFQQAAAQGQTLIASAGDSGSTECYGYSVSTAQQEALAINYPADSQYVTAIGGTQMAAGTFGAGTSQYWASAGSTPVLSSLLSYVPEVVWNEDSSSYGFAAGGGGISSIFAAPTWQQGVAGIPTTNTFRLNPDISFQASVASPGYLACSSDPTSFATGQTSSCAVGIYDQTQRFITSAGGTSFGAPIFAGLMAVLNQVEHGTGQGSVNPTLYGLAANSTTYASVFHDITSGNNNCSLIASSCSAGLTEFAATTGYDEASGLGSIDFGALIKNWPSSKASLATGTSTVLSAATTSPASGATDVISITVSPAVTGGTPTGSVQIYLANEAAPTYNANLSTAPPGTVVATVPLSSTGTATYTFPGTTVAGTQVITATYSGDATYAPSVGAVALTLANTLTPSGSFTMVLNPTSVTVPVDSYGVFTATVTPSGGYNGLLNLTANTLPAADCLLEGTYPAVSGVTQLTLAIGNGTECTSNAAVRVGNQVLYPVKNPAAGKAKSAAPNRPWDGQPETMMAAGLLAFGLTLRRRKIRKVPSLLVLAGLTMVAGLGLSGCGGSGTPVVTTGGGSGGGTAQTLTLSVVGTDSITSSITSSATLNVTIQ